MVMGNFRRGYGIRVCKGSGMSHHRPQFRPRSLKQIEFVRKRFAELREGNPQLSLSQIIKLYKSGLQGTDQDQTALVSGIDIQGKSSSDVVTSTSEPQTIPTRLDGMKNTLASQVSLLRCSACMQIIPKGSDQDQTTLVSQIDNDQEKLSSDILSSTSKAHQAKHLRSSSKMHKPKASLKKKKKKKKKKNS